jgi:hypothetical protein
MHLQVRAMMTAGFTTGDEAGSPEATTVATPGALIRLLQRLADNQVNLKTAGGSRIEAGGQFVFALDDDDDQEAPYRAAQLINDDGEWHAWVVEPFHCHTSDQPGGLLGCLQKVEAAGLVVDEIFVGTPEADGSIPLQITTIGLP